MTGINIKAMFAIFVTGSFCFLGGSARDTFYKRKKAGKPAGRERKNETDDYKGDAFTVPGVFI